MVLLGHVKIRDYGPVCGSGIDIEAVASAKIIVVLLLLLYIFLDLDKIGLLVHELFYSHGES